MTRRPPPSLSGPATPGPGSEPIAYRTPGGQLIIAQLDPGLADSPLRRHLAHPADRIRQEHPTP